MADASNFFKLNGLNAALRGVAYPVPAGTYVALHTAAPNDATGGNEVTLGAWPAYVRKHAENGGAIGTGWTNPPTDDGADSFQCKNVYALPYPANNGAGPVIVTHFSVWDALTGGNMITSHALVTPVQIDPLEVFVFDVATLTVKLT